MVSEKADFWGQISFPTFHTRWEIPKKSRKNVVKPDRLIFFGKKYVKLPN